MLTFILKKEWYEKIKSGEKRIDYREVKKYWWVRFGRAFQPDMDSYGNIHGYLGVTNDFPPELAQCKLRLGYTKNYLSARIKKIEIVDGNDTDLHINKPVYAIYIDDVRQV